MVKNGYVINVSTAKLPFFLDGLRRDLKGVIREQVLMQIAKETEKLYDMKFIEQAKYSDSIFNCALQAVAQRISGVALGAYRDAFFDFRATLIIAKASDNNQKQYVLLNTENDNIKKYFEDLPEVKGYKFDRFMSEDYPHELKVVNQRHGEFWHELFEKCDWNMSMLGYAAQLSTQPDVMSMGFTPSDLEHYFSDPDIRMLDYISRTIIVNKVSELIGSTPIEKINPYSLTEYFERAFAHRECKDGIDESLILHEKVCKGFCDVDISSLSLSE